MALTVRLDRVPPVWWDEGWTLSVARNWVDLGHYGRLLSGEPIPRGLEFAFPVTGTVALSFWLFGVGVFQARLVAVLFTLSGLALLYELARRFYNRSIGIATLAAAVCLASKVEINPLYAGRQVVGEMPALLFLLAGYLCFMSAEKRVWLLMPSAICCWSLALLLRIQARPFFVAALVLPLVMAIFRRQMKSAKLFAAGLVGSVTSYLLFCNI